MTSSGLAMGPACPLSSGDQPLVDSTSTNEERIARGYRGLRTELRTTPTRPDIETPSQPLFSPSLQSHDRLCCLARPRFSQLHDAART